jgi:GNAT superfamily N-acetyltransferase
VLDPKSYVFKETLKDGTQVTLRAARADDGPKIQQAFSKLLRETIYTRFFTNKTEISDAELKRVTEVDFEWNVVLLVTLGSGDEEVVIGGASYVLLDTDPSDRSAEVAFTVEEDYQRLGVASLLMRHIIWIARDAGLTSLQADVLTHNAAMLAVFRRSGLPMTTRLEDGAVRVKLSLDQNAMGTQHRPGRPAVNAASPELSSPVSSTLANSRRKGRYFSHLAGMRPRTPNR